MNESSKHIRATHLMPITALILVLVGVAAFAYGFLRPVVAEADVQTITGQLDGAQQAAMQDMIDEMGYANSDVSTQSLSDPDDCSATIYYFEYADYEDPDAIMVEPGLRYLGAYTITGLKEGQQLNAWDYVVDIPGHFFFDGWPFSVTVSTDPSKNTFELIYFKLYNYEYTVNYYLMTGADLQADNWTDALAPADVTFEKLGSETFYDQRFDQLVVGDAYEYKLDGMYVIDTYPAQIRLGADADNNVINVLYTPTSTTLPDTYEVVEGTNPPGSDDALYPEDTILPDDEVFDKDEIIDLIPGAGENDTITGDFIGPDEGTITITDEMIEHPVNKDQAEQMIYAYQTGKQEANLPQAGDVMGSVVWAVGGAAIAAAVALIIASIARRRTAHEQ